MLTEKEKRIFLKQLLVSNSINLPAVADMHGICWDTGVKPALEKDSEFRADVQSYLEKCKYTLLQKVFTVATDGVLDGGRKPDLSFIKEICKLIDSGVITGTAIKEEAPPPAEPQKDAAAEKEAQAQSEAAAFIMGALPKN